MLSPKQEVCDLRTACKEWRHHVRHTCHAETFFSKTVPKELQMSKVDTERLCAAVRSFPCCTVEFTPIVRAIADYRGEREYLHIRSPINRYKVFVGPQRFLEWMQQDSHKWEVFYPWFFRMGVLVGPDGVRQESDPFQSRDPEFGESMLKELQRIKKDDACVHEEFPDDLEYLRYIFSAYLSALTQAPFTRYPPFTVECNNHWLIADIPEGVTIGNPHHQLCLATERVLTMGVSSSAVLRKLYHVHGEESPRLSARAIPESFRAGFSLWVRDHVHSWGTHTRNLRMSDGREAMVRAPSHTGYDERPFVEHCMCLCETDSLDARRRRFRTSRTDRLRRKLRHGTAQGASNGWRMNSISCKCLNEHKDLLAGTDEQGQRCGCKSVHGQCAYQRRIKRMLKDGEDKKACVHVRQAKRMFKKWHACESNVIHVPTDMREETFAMYVLLVLAKTSQFNHSKGPNKKLDTPFACKRFWSVNHGCRILK